MKKPIRAPDIRKTTARLTSSKKVETANVEISIKNSLQTKQINFVNAFPDSIRLETSALTISLGYSNNIVLTTTLLRKRGTPSVANFASLVVNDSNGNPIGNFINYSDRCNDSGIIINKYTLSDSNYHGALQAIATTLDSLGNKKIAVVKLISP